MIRSPPMHLQRSIRILNQAWRFDPTTGFLRCTCVFLQAGPMLYGADELGAQHLGKPTIMVDVPAEALADPFAITSLEGAPIVVGHTWQTVESTDAIGSVAGRPYVDEGSLLGDVLVRDAETVRRIMLPAGDPNRLEELSTGFDALVDLTPGPEVDGRFHNIRYNHVALLLAGQARGGSSVRIINEVQSMPTTAYRLPSGRTIRIENDDLPKMDEEVADAEAKTKNAVDPAKAAESLAALEVARGELAEKQKEVDALMGELQGLKDALDKAMGADTIEQAAEQLTQERTAAQAVANAHGVELTAEQRKLRGHGLRLAVVNAVAGAELAEDEAKNEAFVSGLFKGYSRASATPPAGHQVAKVENTATTVAQAAPDMTDAAARRARLGY